MHVYNLTDADRPAVKIAALVNSAAAARSSLLGQAADNALDALALYDQARIHLGQQGSPRPADQLLVETNALNAMTSLLASNSVDEDAVLGQVSLVANVAESPGINSEARIHALLQAASAIDSLARLKPHAISAEHMRRMVRWVEQAYEATRAFPPDHAGRIDSASLFADILLSPERVHYTVDPERDDVLGHAEQIITESARSLAGAPVTRMHHLQWANVGRFYVANARFDDAIEAYYQACRYADNIVDSALTSATRLAEASAAGDVYQRLIFLLIHVGRAVEAGDVAQRSRWHWRRNSDTIPDLHDVIRSRTEQDTMLLYAGTCGFGAWVIAYASSALAAAWVATIDTSRLTTAVVQLQSATSRQDIDDSLTTAAEILKPGILDNVANVIGAAGAARLSLIPSGLFASLPIASLESDGRSWSDLTEVTHLVSAAEPLGTGTSVVRVGEGFLVSDPTQDLEYAAVEAESARRWDPQIHEPAETGLRAWLLDNLPKARHLHLACHARYEPGDPYESHFRLGKGLRLTVADISVLSSNIDLVIASACQTALVGVASTEMAVGLGQTLIAAGARGVIAALWDVPDLGTAMVIARFYEELRHDGLAGASLRRAQAYLRNACVDDLLAGLGDWVPQGVDHELRALALSPRYRDGVRKPFASPSQWAALVYIGA
jgi:CHAT domain-containing protein